MKTLNERQELRIREIIATIHAVRTGYGTWTITATIDGDSYRVTTHDEDRFESIRYQGDNPRYTIEEMADWFEEMIGLSY